MKLIILDHFDKNDTFIILFYHHICEEKANAKHLNHS